MLGYVLDDVFQNLIRSPCSDVLDDLYTAHIKQGLKFDLGSTYCIGNRYKYFWVN
jgi:hypothetical protein